MSGALASAALAVAALASAGSSWAASSDEAAALENSRPDPPVLDLVAQAPGSDALPAIVTLRISEASGGATLRARLYEPVTTRTELWHSATGPAPTPQLASWVIEDFGAADADEGGTLVSVPIPPPDGASGNSPRPLHIELTAADGTVIDTLRTFLTPAPDAAAARSVGELTVAVVVDLRLPPAHTADGGAQFDPAVLDRVLGLARVPTDRPGLPVTVDISPETLDALALIGDDDRTSVLRAALDGRQLLASPWTSLDINGWIETGRADVVIDGLRRSEETLNWIGMEASTVMRFSGTPSPAAVALATDPAVGVTGFLADRVFSTPLNPLVPVTLVDDATGGRHLMAQADPLLEAALRIDDPELGAQWALAELLRMAGAADEPNTVIVVASAFLTDWDAYAVAEGGSPRPVVIAGTEPEALALLLDGLAAHAALRPATVDTVLAESAPIGEAEGPFASAPRLGPYFERRSQAERQLHAYESMIGTGNNATAPLHTLLAVSANSSLTAERRAEFLDAVGRQVAQGAIGVELIGRGRITVTEPSADLPVTLVNSRSAPVTVALELASERLDFPDGDRLVVRLEPGRNDLSVPIRARAAGRADVAVTVTTPDEAGEITLSAGTLRVRYAAAEGLGLLILVAVGAAVAAWWLRAWRRRSLAPGGTGATVAPPGPAAGIGGVGREGEDEFGDRSN